MGKKQKNRGGKKDDKPWSKGGRSSGKGGGVRKKPQAEHKPAPVYSAAQRILVVGDGDFSFCAGLMKHTRAGNVVATSLNTKAECVKKYGASATKCIEACEKAGACVKHGVDATALHNKFAAASFHCCVFNFPHTGEQRVHSNQAMLRAFFQSARPLLKVGGEIHITLKMAPPYSEWDVPAIAQSAGYVKWRVRPFDFAQFPGYKHRTTLSDAKHLDTTSNGAAGKTVTLVFRRIQQAQEQQAQDASGEDSKGAVSQGAVSQGAVSQGAVSQGAVSKGAVSQGAGRQPVPHAQQPASVKRVDRDTVTPVGGMRPVDGGGSACGASASGQQRNALQHAALKGKGPDTEKSCSKVGKRGDKVGPQRGGSVQKVNVSKADRALQKKKAKKKLHACAAAKAKR